MRLHLRSDERIHAVDVAPHGEAWRVTIDGETFTLDATHDGAGSWLVDGEDGRRRFVVGARGDERFVFVGGRTHRLQVCDPDAADDDEDDAGGPAVRAAMPGKVVRVLVAEGDAVAAGQPVLLVESMKMETELAAAVGGKVAAVHVEAGQVVAQGELLLDVTPDEAT